MGTPRSIDQSVSQAQWASYPWDQPETSPVIRAHLSPSTTATSASVNVAVSASFW